MLPFTPPVCCRINTILDSSRVLVMEDGVVKEYDSVPRLMGRSDSTFRRMVVSAGARGGRQSGPWDGCLVVKLLLPASACLMSGSVGLPHLPGLFAPSHIT